MLIKPGRSSGNIIDRRGRGGGKVGLGIGGLVVLLIGAFFGLDLSPLLGGGGVSTAPPTEETTAPEDDAGETVDAILAETETVWGELYRQAGETYPEPGLVLYDGVTQTACGYGQAATGPFYCPNDQRVYLDLAFFRQLQRMGAQGDFAVAYVIAHEVGHHVQNVEGLLGAARTSAASVRTELQADCLAGIWTHYAAADERGDRIVLNDADIQSGISAAAAVGDDQIQQSAGQTVRPETFTHGSSQQRVSAFLSGYQSGEYGVCFGA